MGFASAQLSTPVKDLSGGQKRRLQLLLILLEQPNVLILDEPSTSVVGWACPLILRGSRPRRKRRGGCAAAWSAHRAHPVACLT